MKANNVIIFVILFLSSVSYCFADMKILKINQSHYMSPYNKEPGDRNLCNKWVLNASQIEKIFSLSDKYKEMSDTMTGFWLWFPCEITGELIYNKKKWHFSINAAATAEWSDGKETIYWGCSREKCDDMFILPYPGRSYIGGGGKLVW
ncbi:hypothetical protein ABX050_003128 [Salmonella enterica]|nr:hypothetical protein [Salmonella enterica subsp. enterica serovar Salford]EGG8165246.1 hypothetical protein [Salmonella enterica subsp. enterica serovar Yaba]EIU1274716.1 hypothetical protein [Salmonella enterica subsp. enterica serovar Salford]EKN5737771.1 hypothetical protein [Salmonella enterica]EKR6581147.1 hypothetical protein [Salmonella enterica subsp. enterica serovar Salford]